MELECCYRVFNNILPKTFCDEVIDYVNKTIQLAKKPKLKVHQLENQI